MTEKNFTVTPVGYVRNSKEGTYLEIASPYIPALQGLKGFGHINVLWWCHLYDEYREMVECDQPYKDAPAKMGIFATRAPVRPNPIALTTVAVLDVDEKRGIIMTPYIDAEDGSPILDIKPYHPAEDRVRDVAVPDWCASWPKWLEESATFDWESVFVNAR
ncbi:MAG: SAM-dependent methyltransferase [Anaerolineae bacterium]|nr:SAM-dependent methyltransferase [Anaerolineae bacterium]